MPVFLISVGSVHLFISYSLSMMGYSMTKLGEYLGERYHPDGDVFKIALTTGLIERSGFTVNYYNPIDGINMTLVKPQS